MGSGRAGRAERLCGPELASALEQLAEQSEAPLFVVLQTLVKVLLYRYSGHEDLTVVAPISGRSAGEEAMVGLYLRMLPLRDRLHAGIAFSALLANASHTFHEAYLHRDESLEGFGAESWNVLVGFQNTPVSGGAPAGLRVSRFALRDTWAKCDLAFEFVPRDGSLLLVLNYNEDRIESSMAELMVGHLSRLMESVVATPEALIEDLVMITRSERKQILSWNETRREYAREAGLWEQFCEQARTRPAAVALEYGAERITYGELAKRAEVIAGRLRAAGVKAGSAVLVGMERTPWLIVSTLGVLRAGEAMYRWTGLSGRTDTTDRGRE